MTSILPTNAVNNLTSSQVDALDASYAATSKVIAAINSTTEKATEDTLFVSLDSRVALAQYEAGLADTSSDSTTTDQSSMSAMVVNALTKLG